MNIELNFPDLPRPRNRAGWSAVVDLATIAIGLVVVAAALYLASLWPGLAPGTGASSASEAKNLAISGAARHLERCATCRASGLAPAELARAERGFPCLRSPDPEGGEQP